MARGVHQCQCDRIGDCLDRLQPGLQRFRQVTNDRTARLVFLNTKRVIGIGRHAEIVWSVIDQPATLDAIRADHEMIGQTRVRPDLYQLPLNRAYGWIELILIDPHDVIDQIKGCDFLPGADARFSLVHIVSLHNEPLPEYVRNLDIALSLGAPDQFHSPGQGLTPGGWLRW